MASSAFSTTNPNSKSSRFSTSLKAFKFSAKGREPKPPPPPPKDTYYLKNNRSLASLSPDTFSIPNSPLSPHSQRSLRPSPDNMNQSSVSLVSLAASAQSSSPAETRAPKSSSQTSKKSSKGSGFFKFTRRSPKPPSIRSPDSSEVATEDENISFPWNFQHNIHVDEAFSGLPPSWTTSLAKAGFTEEEIADIQSRRRLGSRSPASQYLFDDRPASPAYSSSHPPILTNPVPRTTSLPRLHSEPLPRGGTEPGASLPSLPLPPVPSGIAPTPETYNRSLPARQFSADQLSFHSHHPSSSLHSLSNSISNSVESHVTNNSGGVGNVVPGVTMDPVRPVSPSGSREMTEPSTPPRRIYHITNDPPITSPPPSYTHYNGSTDGNGISYPHDKKENKGPSSIEINSTPRSRPAVTPSSSAVSPQTTPSRNQPTQTHFDSSHSRSASASSSSSGNQSLHRAVNPRVDNLKRLTALPPRLSLHKSSESADLSSWGEALLSGISSASADRTPNTSVFATAQDSGISNAPNEPHNSDAFTSTNSAYYSRIEAEAAKRPSNIANKADKSKKQLAPAALPLHLRDADGVQQPRSAFDSDDEEAVPPSSYVEPASSARYEPAAALWGSSDYPLKSAAAQSDSVSPLWNGVVAEDESSPDHLSAALSETFSPTIPFSPPDDQCHARVTKGQRVESNASLLKAEEEGTGRGSNRDSSRSSTSTVMALEPATIVRHVSIIRRAGAYVVDKSNVAGGVKEGDMTGRGLAAVQPPSPTNLTSDSRQPPSPLSSTFGSEEGSPSGSGSSSSLSQGHETPTTEPGLDSSLMYYLDSTASPDPSKLAFHPHVRHMISGTDTFGGIKAREDSDDDREYDVELDATIGPPIQRPKIVISDDTVSTSPAPAVSSSGVLTPLSPFQRYRGWLSAVVAPLEQFIDDAIDPRNFYLDLQEIAEGESGSVFAARLTDENIHHLKLPPHVKERDSDDLAEGLTTVVAIKSVSILPSGSPKLIDLEKELTLMKGLWHDNVLSMDAVYVDLVEDALWIRMELMERSLADIIGLVPQSLVLQDRTIARFASDVLHALEFLQRHHIAHRDVRSDNLLVNSQGFLKLTDFSTAVQVERESPLRIDLVGVAYWQAPEIRSPPYNVLKVDVWSLGATAWEMAEAEPPFSETQQFGERWPPLNKPQLYSPAYHDFLRMCSEPPLTRPSPTELTKHPFIRNACGRPVIIQLISQCMALEQALLEGDATRGSASE